MLPSMVDYVLQKGSKQYASFYMRSTNVQTATLLNQRKLLEYLFSPQKQIKNLNRDKKGLPSISELKFSQIITQLTILSEKIHNTNKKNVTLDGQIYKLENQWYKKKIPQFYSYYFLKFGSANPVHKFQKVIFQENINMAKENDSYTVIRKAIEARESCLANIRKQSIQLTKSIIEQDLVMIQSQLNIQSKIKVQHQMNQNSYKSNVKEYQSQKTWKNKLEMFFDSVFHLRKLTLYIIDMIRKWKHNIYSLTQDPQRYKERIIFYHSNANYLLKILIDNRFLVESQLNNYLQFGQNYDPFLLKPLFIFENKKKSPEEQILYNLLKLKEKEMQKIVKALQILAEEEYDQDINSRFLNQKKTLGELQFKKKFNHEKKTTFNSQSKQFIKGNKIRELKKTSSQVKIIDQRNSRVQQIQNQRTSIKNTRNKSLVDLNKISPYLSKNQKANQFLYQSENRQNKLKSNINRLKMEPISGQKIMNREKSSITWLEQGSIEELKKINQNEFFNKYIDENLKKMEQQQKKKFYKKNKFSTPRNKEIFPQDKKEKSLNKTAIIQKLLTQQKRKQQRLNSLYPKGIGMKSVLQISNSGMIKTSKNRIIKSQSNKKLNESRTKTISSILEKNKKQDYQKKVLQKIYPQDQKYPKQKIDNQRKAQIIVLRQQPEKLQEIKNFLYSKIKQQLMSEMVKQNQKNQNNLNNIIESQRKRRILQLVQAKTLQQRMKKEQQERRIRYQKQLLLQRKKLNPQITIELIQYSQQNLHQYIQQIFKIQPTIFNNLFDTNQSNFLKYLQSNFYNVFFKIKLKEQEIGYVFASYQDSDIFRRKFLLRYISVFDNLYFIRILHNTLIYIWSNDPAEQIEIIMYKNTQSNEGAKLISDLQQYTGQNGQLFQKRLYSNIIQKKFVFTRNYTDYPSDELKQKNNIYNRNLIMKIELLSSNKVLNQGSASKIDINLEQNTNYMFLIQELFRNHLTPEQIIELRQNSKNLRRLKDIFKIILELEKNKPKIQQLKILQALNMDDLTYKIKQNTSKPYQKYEWKQYFDIANNNNRLILAILQIKLELPFVVNSGILNDKYFMRIKTQQKMVVLKSSIYSKDLIYIIPTKNEKLKLFLVRASIYKQMRIQMFTFLNLLFNNIIFDDKYYLNSIWLPQINISNKSETANRFCKKQITKVTDFSITMKKNVWVAQEIYFCNKQYLKNGISITPQQSDEIFLDAFIYGVLHTDIQNESVGVPIFGKLIDKESLFQRI